MSHIVSIQTEVRDPAAVAAACRRLGLPEPVHGTARLFERGGHRPAGQAARLALPRRLRHRRPASCASTTTTAPGARRSTSTASSRRTPSRERSRHNAPPERVPVQGGGGDVGPPRLVSSSFTWGPRPCHTSFRSRPRCTIPRPSPPPAVVSASRNLSKAPPSSSAAVSPGYSSNSPAGSTRSSSTRPAGRSATTTMAAAGGSSGTWSGSRNSMPSRRPRSKRGGGGTPPRNVTLQDGSILVSVEVGH